MRAIVSQCELKAMFAQAQRIAAALSEPVGPRELLLAAVTVCPEVVLACARDRGIEMHRLVWALREWGPVNSVDPAIASATSMTPTARALVTHAAKSGAEQACSTLVDRLLNPATFGYDCVSGAAHDVTGAVLSWLKLI